MQLRVFFQMGLKTKNLLNFQERCKKQFLFIEVSKLTLLFIIHNFQQFYWSFLVIYHSRQNLDLVISKCARIFTGTSHFQQLLELFCITVQPNQNIVL